MKILVIGGHGFVGSNLTTLLKSHPTYKVIVASRRNGLDLSDYGNTRSYLTKNKPDVIYNCAAHVGSVHYIANHAADVIHDNMLTVINLYKAVSEVSSLSVIINPLSNCSYPGEANIHYEPDWWKGEVHESVFSYGNAKRFIYVISKCYKKQYGINTVNFLVPNAFGPGDYLDPNKVHAVNGMIIRLIQAKENKAKEFEIWGTGQPIREWGYIKDIVKILEKGITFKDELLYPVNIAQNKGYSIRKSAMIISKIVGYKGKLVFNKNYEDGAPIKILDNRNFRKFFPNYQFTDHEKAIKETIKYYKQNLD